MRNILKEYIKLEAKFRELEAEKDAKRLEILNAMQKEKMQKIDTDFGSFTVCFKKSWKYSEKITKLVENLKIKKSIEEQKGIATATESEYLLFKANE